MSLSYPLHRDSVCVPYSLITHNTVLPSETTNFPSGAKSTHPIRVIYLAVPPSYSPNIRGNTKDPTAILDTLHASVLALSRPTVTTPFTKGGRVSGFIHTPRKYQTTLLLKGKKNPPIKNCAIYSWLPEIKKILLPHLPKFNFNLIIIILAGVPPLASGFKALTQLSGSSPFRSIVY